MIRAKPKERNPKVPLLDPANILWQGETYRYRKNPSLKGPISHPELHFARRYPLSRLRKRYGFLEQRRSKQMRVEDFLARSIISKIKSKQRVGF